MKMSIRIGLIITLFLSFTATHVLASNSQTLNAKSRKQLAEIAKIDPDLAKQLEAEQDKKKIKMWYKACTDASSPEHIGAVEGIQQGIRRWRELHPYADYPLAHTPCYL